MGTKAISIKDLTEEELNVWSTLAILHFPNIGLAARAYLNAEDREEGGEGSEDEADEAKWAYYSQVDGFNLALKETYNHLYRPAPRVDSIRSAYTFADLVDEDEPQPLEAIMEELFAKGKVSITIDE